MGSDVVARRKKDSPVTKRSHICNGGGQKQSTSFNCPTKAHYISQSIIRHFALIVKAMVFENDIHHETAEIDNRHQHVEQHTEEDEDECRVCRGPAEDG